MRILQVVHCFPPQEWAGTELVTYYLSQALQARGHEVTVFTRTGVANAAEGTLLEEEFAGLPVLRVVNTYKWYVHFSFRYDNPFFNKVFLSVLQRVQPQVVHVQHVQHLSISMIRLATALGYPTILSLHDFYFLCQRIHLIDAQERFCPGPERGERCVPCLQDLAPAEEVRRRFVQMEQVLQRPQVVITPSHFLAEKMQTSFPRLGDRLRTIPLGVKHPALIDQERPPRSSGAPVRVLYVGVLFPHKGAHVLLEALKGIPKDAVTVSLYGAEVGGEEAYTARLRAAAEGLPVQFHGSYTHDEVGMIFAHHDVLVMPMIWEETFSILTREAFLAGLPVIAARRGALIEAVQDGVNGLLFEPENAKDLRRCLMRFVTEPELAERFRRAAPPVKTIEEYANEIEGLYREVQDQQQGEKRQSAEDAAKLGALVLPPSPTAAPATVALSPQDEGKDERVIVQERLPQVSVCIPMYNGAAFLAEAISSVLAQSFRDFELLLVDDGSTDATLEIARSFTDPRLILQQNEKRLGIPANWNRCVSLARGEYICIFHQDDVMLPENLACKVRALNADATISFIHSAVEVLMEAHAPSLLTIDSATEDFVVDGQAYFRQLLLRGNRICAPTVLARRRALCDIGLFDEALGFTPDYAAWMCLCLEGRVGFLCQPLVQYRWHEHNASHQYRFEYGVEEVVSAGEKAIRYYVKRTGQQETGAFFQEALTALAELRRRIVELERGKQWLDAERANWQQTVHEQQAWIAELEQGKQWLDEQRANWQQTAERMGKDIQELKEWIGQLEKSKAELWEKVERLQHSWIPYPLKRVVKSKK
jgi:glycosyltransferase involved in cell wall biosynthesis